MVGHTGGQRMCSLYHRRYIGHCFSCVHPIIFFSIVGGGYGTIAQALQFTVLWPHQSSEDNGAQIGSALLKEKHLQWVLLIAGPFQ